MEQFTVINMSTLSPEVRRQKEIEQLKLMIDGHSHNAQSTERYIRMYRNCLSEARLVSLQCHLRRLIDEVVRMRWRYDNL